MYHTRLPHELTKVKHLFYFEFVIATFILAQTSWKKVSLLCKGLVAEIIYELVRSASGNSTFKSRSGWSTRPWAPLQCTQTFHTIQGGLSSFLMWIKLISSLWEVDTLYISYAWLPPSVQSKARNQAASVRGFMSRKPKFHIARKSEGCIAFRQTPQPSLIRVSLWDLEFIYFSDEVEAKDGMNIVVLGFRGHIFW